MQARDPPHSQIRRGGGVIYGLSRKATLIAVQGRNLHLASPVLICVSEIRAPGPGGGRHVAEAGQKVQWTCRASQETARSAI